MNLVEVSLFFMLFISSAFAQAPGSRIEDRVEASKNREKELNGMLSYDASTCEWTNEIPRTIIEGPSCGRTPNKICFGYVVCDQKAPKRGKFIRKVSCDSEYCGNGDAQKCMRDKSYRFGKHDKSLSRDIKELIESKASAQ